MEEARAFVRRAAPVRAPVLILGETGTGKTLLGRTIHRAGPRHSGPFLGVNCAGIPDSLFESEFFGHHRGAFTGARESRRGFLEQAHGGSIFLDEVGELTVSQQAKLLMALEDGEVRRLGGEGTVRVDVRVLAATSRDLAAEMRSGGFRRELFHRLAVLTCRLPPLRERREDIQVLARRFLGTLLKRHGREPMMLNSDALRYLMDQPWPGNVRELSHLLEAAVILSDGRTLDVGDLQKAKLSSEGRPVERPNETGASRAASGSRYSFSGPESEEKNTILATLERLRGNKTRAARELGMARNTLKKKLRRYGVE